MAKNIKRLLEEIDALSKKNAVLMQGLGDAMESLDAIRSENIDALAMADDETLNVYSEKSSDKPYRILIEKMNEGAVTLYTDGSIVYCNSYFANMVNLPLQKIIGSLFTYFIEDKSKQEVEVLLKKGRAQTVKEEIFILSSDGKKIPVLMILNALPLEAGSVLSIILTDLTIHKENQEELRLRNEQLQLQNEKLESIYNDLSFQITEKEKRSAELSIAKTDVKELEGINNHIENVLATISHDLRSPLASIIGMADVLNDDLDTMDHGTIKTMIGLLYKATTNELKMLDYLLEWARIKYASDAFSPVNIGLDHYVTKVFEILNDNAASKNLQLKNEIEENTDIFADGNMLLSVLQNIVSNSIKFSYVGGEIIVSSKINENKITVRIKDNGIGMTEKVKEKLFIPQIASLSKTRKAKKGGGIGLLLAKGFLEKMGGTIWVESVEGEGSSFYFTLPVLKPEDRREQTVPSH